MLSLMMNSTQKEAEKFAGEIGGGQYGFPFICPEVGAG
jgi:hypothetical protein